MIFNTVLFVLSASIAQAQVKSIPDSQNTDQKNDQYILLEVTEDSENGAENDAENGVVNTDGQYCDECSPCRMNGHFISGHFNWGAYLDVEGNLVGGSEIRYEYQAPRGGGIDASFGHMAGRGIITGKVTGWIPVKAVGNFKHNMHVIAGGTAVDRNYSNTKLGAVGAGVAWINPFKDQSIRVMAQPIAYFEERGLFEGYKNNTMVPAHGLLSGIAVQGMFTGGEPNEEGICRMSFQGGFEVGVVHNLNARDPKNHDGPRLEQEGAGAYFSVNLDGKTFLGQKRKWYVLGRISVQNYFIEMDGINNPVNGKINNAIETGNVTGAIGVGFRVGKPKQLSRPQN